LLQRALEFCLHDKGVYVTQAAANVASNSELVEMAKVTATAHMHACCWHIILVTFAGLRVRYSA
jgi:hypothetical protein